MHRTSPDSPPPRRGPCADPATATVRLGRQRLTTAVWGEGPPSVVLLHDGLGSIGQWQALPRPGGPDRPGRPRLRPGRPRLLDAGARGPVATSLILDGRGHLLHHEDPAALIEVVGRFVEQHRSTTS